MSAFGTSLGDMLDIQFIREHADVVKESQRKRGESVELVERCCAPTRFVVPL